MCILGLSYNQWFACGVLDQISRPRCCFWRAPGRNGGMRLQRVRLLPHDTAPKSSDDISSSIIRAMPVGLNGFGANRTFGAPCSPARFL